MADYKYTSETSVPFAVSGGGEVTKIYCHEKLVFGSDAPEEGKIRRSLFGEPLGPFTEAEVKESVEALDKLGPVTWLHTGQK